jgi:hypothetical protein
MSPSLATKVASLARPWRVYLWLLIVLAVSMLAVSVWAGKQLIASVAFMAVGPVVGLAWAALGATTWFHPEKGRLSPSAHYFGQLPASLRNAVRWCASLFLSLFALLMVVLWPLSSASVLWHFSR